MDTERENKTLKPQELLDDLQLQKIAGGSGFKGECKAGDADASDGRTEVSRGGTAIISTMNGGKVEIENSGSIAGALMGLDVGSGSSDTLLIE